MARRVKVRDANVHPAAPSKDAFLELHNQLLANQRAGDFGAGTNLPGKTVTAQSVEEHALDTFGTVEKAEHWLNRPNPLFSGKTPRQVLRVDPSWVEAALVRIDYGVYA
jgi:Protein of unknown function (DUF2384)